MTTIGKSKGDVKSNIVCYELKIYIFLYDQLCYSTKNRENRGYLREIQHAGKKNIKKLLTYGRAIL